MLIKLTLNRGQSQRLVDKIGHREHGGTRIQIERYKKEWGGTWKFNGFIPFGLGSGEGRLTGHSSTPTLIYIRFSPQYLTTESL